jgi:amino acid transporter
MIPGVFFMPDTHPASSFGQPSQPAVKLSLFDAASIIVGIIIGAGFLRAAPTVAAWAGSVPATLLVWAVGAAIALCGAMCYAEMATRFPQDGGDYLFLSRSFGRRVGFLFAWTSLLVVRPGNIGIMAVVFAEYAVRLVDLPGVGIGPDAQLYWAMASILFATAVNLIGLSGGRLTQNLLTVAKVAGLLALFGAAALLPTTRDVSPVAADAETGSGWLGALVLVMFAYGGWADVTYVAAEVRNPRRNLWRALLLGTSAVATIYLLGTLAFFRALGFEGVAGSRAVAVDVLGQTLGDAAGRAMALLVCVACLGAINGMVLTGGRVFFAIGQDHRVFKWLGRKSSRGDTPTRSLITQSAVTIVLLWFFSRYPDGFEKMVNFTGPIFWLFFLLAGLAVFRLRRSLRTDSGYHVPLYPVTPILFCLSSVFMLWQTVQYAWQNKSVEAFWTLGSVVVGIAVVLFGPSTAPPSNASQSGEGAK